MRAITDDRSTSRSTLDPQQAQARTSGLSLHLSAVQRWLAVDREEALLKRLPTLMSSCEPWLRGSDGLRPMRDQGGLMCHVETRRVDLGVLNA